ncbi:TorD/DmsD family molecular chaperone [Vibrio cincinnatiensis]|uniref:TorD/DmsD family molecular chaperone n=1 Tax=Vibrio cincinnatiensis TaxID=675 RepID=UPI001EDD154D|nr:molecular chaperone [Vibrio cincinnatiensis]MCG3730177.1 molecular chaperone [Vibrio cincinnatiensis]
MLAVVPRVLGSLFYYPPHSEPALYAQQDLPYLAEHFSWANPVQIHTLCQALPEPQLEQFSLLFEGIGEMPAPPWGSVYLDPERIVMGESTLAYRQFLQQHGIEVQLANHEPEDQFGLMLLALAHFLEQEQDSAALTLLTDHLLPWADQYLQQLKSACSETDFYYGLAIIAECFLTQLKAHASDKSSFSHEGIITEC